jgi:GT2 family glycosyltransferase
MEKEKIDLSIIILAYNSKVDLKRLLSSVFASETRFSFEVIVVDNGSTDGTSAETISLFSGQNKVIYIQNQNSGFAHGNNVGIKRALGNYILLLNPDTVVRPDTFQTVLDFMENNSDVGVTGCKVVRPDGSLDLACRRRFPNPWNSFKRLFLMSNKDYNYTDFNENKSMAVDSVMGAFLLIRKSVVDKIGLLDESFFMYGEDLDWCWRVKEAGFKVWYHPTTFITHFKGSSSKRTPYKALKWFHDAMWIFYRKHYAKQYFSLFNWLVFAAIYTRLLFLYMANSFRKEKFVSK